MALLPTFKTDDLSQQLLQDKWSAILNPVISRPQINSQIIKSINLVSGANVVNHLLGRKLQGWKIVRQRGPATIYDTQDLNQLQDLTLQLNASANVTVDIEVF